MFITMRALKARTRTPLTVIKTDGHSKIQLITCTEDEGDVLALLLNVSSEAELMQSDRIFHQLGAQKPKSSFSNFAFKPLNTQKAHAG